MKDADADADFNIRVLPADQQYITTLPEMGWSDQAMDVLLVKNADADSDFNTRVVMVDQYPQSSIDT